MRKLWQFQCPDGPKFLIQVTSGSAQKFVWGSMVDFQKTTCNSGVQSTVRLREINCSPYKFKKNRPVKKWTIWGTFGPKFPVFFTSLWPSVGSRRPNRAAVTPISQQNPPRPLKLLGLREKTGKNTDFLILLKKTDFLVAHFVTS